MEKKVAKMMTMANNMRKKMRIKMELDLSQLKKTRPRKTWEKKMKCI